MLDGSPTAENVLKYIDTDAALARVRGNKALFRRMLNMFLDADEFSDLEYSLNEKDYDRAARAAHAIKGIAGNLSLPVLFETSSALLAELRAGAPDTQTVNAYYHTLERTQFVVKEAIIQLDHSL